MKTSKSWCCALLLLVTFPTLAFAGNGSLWDFKLPFKNAVITYKHTGMETGDETLYVRDYGKETARYLKTTTSMMGMVTVDETIEVETPEFIYKFDLRKKSGSKMVNPQVYVREEYDKLTEAEKEQVEINSKDLGLSAIAGMGGQTEQNAAKILGYSCDRVEMMGVTRYNIHGSNIALKTKSDMMGMKALVEAVEVREGEADAKFFDFPAGIEPVADHEADAVSQQVARQTMVMLKDPEATKGRGQSFLLPSPAVPPSGEGVEADQQEMEDAMKMLKELFGK